jgi:hypothetical protein
MSSDKKTSIEKDIKHKLELIGIDFASNEVIKNYELGSESICISLEDFLEYCIPIQIL